MFLELFMLFTCVDSYQKNKRIAELEKKELLREIEEDIVNRFKESKGKEKLDWQHYWK